MKLHSAAAERNQTPILHVLQGVLPAEGCVLELAAGSGQHAVAFARAFPGLRWRPTDRDPAALASIAAHRDEAGLANLEAPGPLDLLDRPWAVEPPDAILAINVLHIAPWAVAEALFGEAGRLLPAGGVLITYGPYRFGATPLAPSNVAFDEGLRARDPAWGIRAVEDLAALGAAAGLGLAAALALPANNHALVWRKEKAHGD